MKEPKRLTQVEYNRLSKSEQAAHRKRSGDYIRWVKNHIEDESEVKSLGHAGRCRGSGGY